MSKLLRVMAIDPGPTPGWAVGEIDPSLPTLTVVETGVAEDIFKMGDLVMTASADVLVYESWRLFGNKAKALIGSDMVASQSIGIIRYRWAQQNCGDPVVQQPKDKDVGLITMSDEFRKQMKTGSGKQHDKDALIHLWLYYWKEYV